MFCSVLCLLCLCARLFILIVSIPDLCTLTYFDMQHDHVLKKLNFDLLTPTPGSGGGG